MIRYLENKIASLELCITTKNSNHKINLGSLDRIWAI